MIFFIICTTAALLAPLLLRRIRLLRGRQLIPTPSAIVCPFHCFTLHIIPPLITHTTTHGHWIGRMEEHAAQVHPFSHCANDVINVCFVTTTQQHLKLAWLSIYDQQR